MRERAQGNLAACCRRGHRYRSEPSGLCQNCGATSITTWYWFSGVYIVETWRCPKASYRVLSINCGVIPMREAVARS